MAENFNSSFTSDDSACTADSGIDICFESDPASEGRSRRPPKALNWSLFPVSSVTFHLPEDWKPFRMFSDLDQYWIAGFVDLFSEYLGEPHCNLWTLHPVSDGKEVEIPDDFRSFVHSSKVRFLCQEFEMSLWYPEDIENVLRYVKAQVDFWHYGALFIPPCRRVLRPNTTRSTVAHRFHGCKSCINGTCTALIVKQQHFLTDCIVPLPPAV